MTCTAIGAAAVTGKPVVAIEGDSAFGFSGMEIETICRYDLPVTTVIFNNNGVYRGDPEGMPYTPTGLLRDARYEKIIEAFGGTGVNATSPDELRRAVNAAMNSGKPTLINAVIDGHFPAHHPDPTVPENLVQLQEEVARRGCDLGIAFDGDGDRIGVVDATGRILWGDQLLILLARDVLKRHPGAPILADVKASDVLFAEVERAGGKPIMLPTGHSGIKAKLAELGALPAPMTTTDFGKYIADDTAKWGKVIKFAGIKAD